MEEIIQKSIEGGYELKPKSGTEIYLKKDGHNWKEIAEYDVLDPLFWQALGKATWAKNPASQSDYVLLKWKENALHFHEINLTQSFDEAVKWLSDLIKQ